MSDVLRCKVEVRESEDGPKLHGTILTEGRAARGGRAELFAPGAVSWPAEGIAIRTEHRGAIQATAVPERVGSEIRIVAPANDAIKAALAAGRDSMSVEFYPVREVRTAGGVREIERALVDAASLTDDPEYEQTRAEVRSRRVQVWL